VSIVFTAVTLTTVIESVVHFRFVCAVLTTNATPSVLRSYDNPEAAELLYQTCKIWEACRATSAATTFFDPITIGPDGQKFADGAIKNNNPVQIVYREAADLWPDQVNDAILISLGTGSAPGPSLEGNINKIIEALKQIATETEDTANDFFLDHLQMANAHRLFRFNVYHGLADVGLEEYKERAKIADATFAYLSVGETRQKLRYCVKELKEIQSQG
jgi:predicted acylesterase/phospholipase RssA